MKMTLFKNKKKQSDRNSSEQLLKILNKLDGLAVEEPEFLEEIKLDIKEGIPLNEKKIELLRSAIDKIKEKNTKDDNNSILTSTNSKAESQTKKTKQKNSFGSFFNVKKFGQKNTKHVSKKDNSASDGHKKDTNLNYKKLENVFKINKHTKESQNISKNQKPTLFAFFKKKRPNKEANSKNTMPDVTVSDNQNIQKKEQLSDEQNESKTNTSKSDELEQQYHSSSVTVEKQNPTNKEETLIPDENDECTLQIEQKETNNEFQIKHELELKEIKKIIDDIEDKKSVLYDDVNAIKSNHNYNKFISRLDELQYDLDKASSGLYTIQSTVYKRLKEMRKLKTDLFDLKSEIEELHFNSNNKSS